MATWWGFFMGGFPGGALILLEIVMAVGIGAVRCSSVSVLRLLFVRKYRWHGRPDIYATKVSP
jgi:hypothetical protein